MLTNTTQLDFFYVQRHERFLKFLSKLKLNFLLRGFDTTVKNTEGERIACQSQEGWFRQAEGFTKISLVSETIFQNVSNVEATFLQYEVKKMLPTLGMRP